MSTSNFFPSNWWDGYFYLNGESPSPFNIGGGGQNPGYPFAIVSDALSPSRAIALNALFTPFGSLRDPQFIDMYSYPLTYLDGGVVQSQVISGIYLPVIYMSDAMRGIYEYYYIDSPAFDTYGVPWLDATIKPALRINDLSWYAPYHENYSASDTPAIFTRPNRLVKKAQCPVCICRTNSEIRDQESGVICIDWGYSLDIDGGVFAGSYYLGLPQVNPWVGTMTNYTNSVPGGSGYQYLNYKRIPKIQCLDDWELQQGVTMRNAVGWHYSLKNGQILKYKSGSWDPRSDLELDVPNTYHYSDVIRAHKYGFWSTPFTPIEPSKWIDVGSNDDIIIDEYKYDYNLKIMMSDIEMVIRDWNRSQIYMTINSPILLDDGNDPVVGLKISGKIAIQNNIQYEARRAYIGIDQYSYNEYGWMASHVRITPWETEVLYQVPPAPFGGRYIGEFRTYNVPFLIKYLEYNGPMDMYLPTAYRPDTESYPSEWYPIADIGIVYAGKQKGVKHIDSSTTLTMDRTPFRHELYTYDGYNGTYDRVRFLGHGSFSNEVFDEKHHAEDGNADGTRHDYTQVGLRDFLGTLFTLPKMDFNATATATPVKSNGVIFINDHRPHLFQRVGDVILVPISGFNTVTSGVTDFPVGYYDYIDYTNVYDAPGKQYPIVKDSLEDTVKYFREQLSDIVCEPPYAALTQDYELYNLSSQLNDYFGAVRFKEEWVDPNEPVT